MLEEPSPAVQYRNHHDRGVKLIWAILSAHPLPQTGSPGECHVSMDYYFVRNILFRF
jgi:hypothetical protein